LERSITAKAERSGDLPKTDTISVIVSPYDFTGTSFSAMQEFRKFSELCGTLRKLQNQTIIRKETLKSFWRFNQGEIKNTVCDFLLKNTVTQLFHLILDPNAPQLKHLTL